ncbi:MAG: DNA-processing protein DprA [Planctomycetota bacterium]
MKQDLEIIRLNLVPGITPRASAALRERFGDAAGVFRADPGGFAGIPGVGKSLRARLADPPGLADARREVRRAERLGLSILHPGDEGYPDPLREIPDPPGVLYVRGSIPAEGTAAAVVGARRATVYGRLQAERFGAGLARGGAIVLSGMARGVDGAAHRGALDAGGLTGAVLGCGLDRVYPPEHRRLAKEIGERGFLLSEQPLGAPPRAHHFPMRNRIIAGIATGVVVIEGKLRSGSLITARLAADFGRYVFALPGRVDSELSRGPHSIVRDGAILVDSPDQVLEDLGLKALTAIEPPPLPADPVQAAILSRLAGGETVGVEEILSAAGHTTPAVLAALTALEVAGRIRMAPGRRYVLRPLN